METDVSSTRSGIPGIYFDFGASEKVRDVESLKEAKSVLECFSILQYENVFSKRNVIFLQFLLKLTECDELNEMCINYALNQEALCYFDNSRTLLVNGFKNVKFHVKGDVDNFSQKEIDTILEEVAEILACEKGDILVNGVLPSMSFILVLLINEAFIGRLDVLNEQDCDKLRRLNINYFIIDEDIFWVESSKGTLVKEIYKERRRDSGVEFAKLCNYLAQKFPKEKLRNLKRVLSASGKIENTKFLMTAKTAMECFSILLNEELFSKNDVNFILNLCKATACSELCTKCREYAIEQKQPIIQESCQHVQEHKGHMYPGRFKILGDLRSDIPIDDIFPTKKGETSKQTRGANYFKEFEEEAFPLVGFLGDRKPLSFLKKRAFVGARKIKTAIKDDPDKVYMPTREVERPGNHPGTSFEEQKFKNVEFYLRGDLKGISVDQIKEMQETVAAVVEDKAIIKQQKQYSLTRFCVVLSLKEEYLTKLIAIEQHNREKLSRLNIEYFVVGPLTVYIERLTDMSHVRHSTYNCIQQKCVTIPTDYIYHISCMASDSLWISGFDGLFEINEKGIRIKKLETDFTLTGSHTVTKNGELLFIRAFNVYLLTKNGEIKQVYLGSLSPSCLHSSRMTEDILVGSCNIVTRHSKQGKLLQEIKLGEKGNLLFENVNYVTENRNGDIIVSDHAKKAVVSVNRSGMHQFDYKGNEYQTGFIPCGVCSDVNGQILVCNSSPDDLSIHLLDQSGQYLMHLLTELQYGLLKPRALCLDEMQNIYVGDTNKLLVVIRPRK